MIMAQAKYKPLLFTTTIRNPERFKDFMYILFKYNGQVLTEKIIEAVEKIFSQLVSIVLRNEYQLA